jgi:hypothetical protein
LCIRDPLTRFSISRNGWRLIAGAIFAFSWAIIFGSALVFSLRNPIFRFPRLWDRYHVHALAGRSHPQWFAATLFLAPAACCGLAEATQAGSLAPNLALVLAGALFSFSCLPFSISLRLGWHVLWYAPRGFIQIFRRLQSSLALPF